MDNKKRNIHNSGPLGMLIKKGQINKVEQAEKPQPQINSQVNEAKKVTGASYFKTQSGIEFAESELFYVDPKECEPWEYANRQEDELGDIDELIESIKANKQLQPALIRKHPTPHDSIKYEIIFGRRRHTACLRLGIPFLVILKDIPNVQEAIATQDAENKFRNDVSNYSNAKLYNKLLHDGVFASEKALSEKLRISKSSLNDLMSFNKIPVDIVASIPDIHNLSVSFALKIATLANSSKKHLRKLIEVAPQIGKAIPSPAKLEKIILADSNSAEFKTNALRRTYTAKDGSKLFTFKHDQRGAPSIAFNKQNSNHIDFEHICQSLQELLQNELT